MSDGDPGQKAVRDALMAIKIRECSQNTVFCITSEDSDGGILSYSSD